MCIIYSRTRKAKPTNEVGNIEEDSTMKIRTTLLITLITFAGIQQIAENPTGFYTTADEAAADAAGEAILENGCGAQACAMPLGELVDMTPVAPVVVYDDVIDSSPSGEEGLHTNLVAEPGMAGAFESAIRSAVADQISFSDAPTRPLARPGTPTECAPLATVRPHARPAPTAKADEAATS